MTDSEWRGIGVQVGPDDWRRFCIFNCDAPCSAGCLSAPHRGRGRTSLHASRVDERFSYCLYVPKSYAEHETRTYPLIVVVHGTERGAQAYRDAFAAFAEQHEVIVFAPLFPCGVIETGLECHNYKFIRFHDIRFDLLLLRMIDEVGALYRINSERFLLFGFSGGGQFAHRFFYLHPERLLGVSIGAPGWVTLFDEERDWWVGVRDIEQQFGRRPDIDALRRVPVQLVAGSDDVETWDVIIPESSRYWQPGANVAGRTRLERLAALGDSLQRHGVSVRHDIVQHAGHEGFKMIGSVQEFFASVLATQVLQE